MMKTYKILLTSLLVLVSSLGFSQSVPSYVPTNGLVGWWGFNGSAQDGSGNGNHGTVNGATLATDRFGNQNGAYSFDGVDDYIQLQSPLLNNAITISFWAYDDGGYPNTYSINPRYVSSEFCNGGFALVNNVVNSPNGIFFARNRGSSSDALFSTVSPAYQVNQNIVFTYDGNVGKFYINGNLVSSISNTGNITTSANLFFGKSGCNNAGQMIDAFNGKLDDIGIWNRALSQQEITNLYNAQLPTQISLCLPAITTTSPSSVGTDSVVIGGNITNDGGSSIVLRGVCYSTSPNPNMGNSRTEDGLGTGSFNTVLRGLTSSTTYYARSYAKNSNGVVVYGNEVSFTTSSSLPGVRCPGTPTVTDIDGNLYHTVQIGNQCWTQSNLKVSKYRNGDNIPTGLSNSAWQNTTSGAYAIYDNNPVNDTLYGKLYNHYAVMDNRGLCPTGWHVPTDGEWNLLTIYLDPNSDTGCGSYPYCAPSCQIGGSLKSTITQPLLGGWISSPYPNTNVSGFSGLGAGYRNHDYFNGVYLELNNVGFWWSSTLLPPFASGRDITAGNDCIAKVKHDVRFGFSVRCLKDVIPSVTTTTVSNVTATSATTGGDVTQDGGAAVTARGVAYGTLSSPTISGLITNDGTGTGTFTSNLTGLSPSTTYYVRAYATNSVGTAYGNEVSFTTPAIPAFACGSSSITDVDGNSYQTVQIGTQCWTQSNLKVSKYRNGDNIPTGLSNTAWQNTTAGAYAIYDNNPVNDGLYGKLYNHYTVMDTRGLCPTGWHVPTDGEWTTLETFLGGSSVAGGALKSTGIQPTPGGWVSPNAGATNSSGFSARPGGRREYNSGFVDVVAYGSWWSSSLSGTDVWARYLHYDAGNITRGTEYLPHGFSVRCLRD
jgi:uncharacterized protein (TIGR02145 family)